MTIFDRVRIVSLVIVIGLLNLICLEMCVADISGIRFSIAALHRSRGHAAVAVVLLKVS